MTASSTTSKLLEAEGADLLRKALEASAMPIASGLAVSLLV